LPITGLILGVKTLILRKLQHATWNTFGISKLHILLKHILAHNQYAQGNWAVGFRFYGI